MASEEVNFLEDYTVAVEGLYDSLKGFNSVAEEARIRYEKALRACEESRVTCERQMAVPQQSAVPSCRERQKLGEEYGAALIAYHDALIATQLPLEILSPNLLDKIGGCRDALHVVAQAFDQHQRACTECGRKTKPPAVAAAHTGRRA